MKKIISASAVMVGIFAGQSALADTGVSYVRCVGDEVEQGNEASARQIERFYKIDHDREIVSFYDDTLDEVRLTQNFRSDGLSVSVSHSHDKSHQRGDEVYLHRVRGDVAHVSSNFGSHYQFSGQCEAASGPPRKRF